MKKIVYFLLVLLFAQCSEEEIQQLPDPTDNTPTIPIPKASATTTNTVAIERDSIRNLLFIGMGDYLNIVDITNPEIPGYKAGLKVGGSIAKIRYNAYKQQIAISKSEGGLDIYNVAVANAPEKLASYKQPSSDGIVQLSKTVSYRSDPKVTDAVIYKDVVLAACSPYGLRVLSADLKKVVGDYSSEENTIGSGSKVIAVVSSSLLVDEKRKKAYLTCSNSGILIFDISNTTDIKREEFFFIGGLPGNLATFPARMNDLAIGGGKMVVPTITGGHGSNPFNPTEIFDMTQPPNKIKEHRYMYARVKSSEGSVDALPQRVAVSNDGSKFAVIVNNIFSDTKKFDLKLALFTLKGTVSKSYEGFAEKEHKLTGTEAEAVMTNNHVFVIATDGKLSVFKIDNISASKPVVEKYLPSN